VVSFAFPVLYALMGRCQLLFHQAQSLKGLTQLVFQERYSFFCCHGASISDKALSEQLLNQWC
jgi:hypothetical protein